MSPAHSTSSTDRRHFSANQTAEANHVSVRVGDGALPPAVVFVAGSVDFDLRFAPLLGHSVGILTVHIESPMTSESVGFGVSKVDREVPITMSKGIGVVVERDLETSTRTRRPSEPHRQREKSARTP